jgi:DNA-binding winged helix-turn-helix (wHTH) protein/tetratricopeptide (TPR) repeat protein
VIYEFASCTLDVATQELSRDGELVHVEPQVLSVLLYLVTHRDRVVPKIELLDQIWGDRFVSESALTSRIKLARKACGDTGRDQRIVRTVHGRGYRFVADVVERTQQAPTRERPTPRPVADSAPAATLIGRAEELAHIEAVLSESRAGNRRSVFVTGEMGSGASTLLAEVVERNDGLDAWFVMRGQCLQGRGGVEPYFPILDAYTRLADSEPTTVMAVLDRYAPSWLAQIPSLAEAGDPERLERRLLGSPPERMLREGVDALSALARERPVLLVLEGLQWADDCTLDVLELLMHRSDAVPLALLGTARTDPSPVRSVIARACAEGNAVEIQLGKLDRADIEALVRERFGGADVPDELVEIVVRRSDGVPLFAQEILTTLLRSGQVVADEDGVRAIGTTDEIATIVPATIPPLIERELAYLDRGVVEVLEAAAVAGIDFDGAAAAAGALLSVPEAEAALSLASRRLSYVEARARSAWPDGTVSTAYSFTHRLYRDVIYERITAGRRAVLHGRIGTALETAYGDRLTELSPVLAEHFVEAEDTARSIEYLRRAGEQASARGAHALAQDLLGRALARAVELPNGPERTMAEVKVRIALGPVLVAVLGWIDPQVRSNYERALSLCDGTDPCPESAAARYGLATVTELRGEFARTEELLLPLLEDEAGGDLAMEAHELLACSTFHQAAFRRSLDNADMVLDSWDESTYSVLMARVAEHPASSCNSWRSLSSWALGQLDDSLARAELAVSQGERNDYALSTATQQRAMLHQLRREPEQCKEWADRTRQVGGEQGFAMRIIQADIYKGWALGVSGSPEEGCRLISDGLERFRSAGATLNEAYYLALYAEAELHAGRAERALSLLDEALATMRSSTRSYFYESEIHRLRARALLGLGGVDRVVEARGELDQSLAIAEAAGSPILALRAAVDRFTLEQEFGDPSPWRDQVSAWLAELDGQDATPDMEQARLLLSA